MAHVWPNQLGPNVIVNCFEFVHNGPTLEVIIVPRLWFYQAIKALKAAYLTLRFPSTLMPA